MKNIAIITKDQIYADKLTRKLLDDKEVNKIVVIGKDLNMPKLDKVIYIDMLPYFPLSTIFTENKINSVVNFVKVDDETYSSKEAYNLTLQSLQNVLYSGARAGVENYILYSSSIIYGVNKKNNPPFKAERLKKSGSKFYYSKLRFESEKIVYEFMDEFPHFNIKICRTPFTLGKNIDNLITSYLKLKYIPQIRGFNPKIEFVHEDDVVNAFKHLIFNGDKGIYNISSGESITLKEVASIMDHKIVMISKFIAKQVAFFSWLLIPKLIRIPPYALDFFLYPFLTDPEPLKDTGFKFQYNIKETIEEFKYSKDYL